MTKTQTKTNYLEEAINSQFKRFSFDEEKTRSILERKLSQPLLPYERNQLYGAIEKFATAWFTNEIAKKYQIISKEIYNLKKEVEYKGDKVQVPSIWNINLMGASAEIETMEVEGTVTRGYNGKNKYKVSARIPEFTEEAKEKYIEALKFGSELYIRGLSDPLISMAILRDANSRIPLPHNSSYYMIWAPDKLELEKIMPKPVDPALLMEYGNKETGTVNFLLHKWDSKNELSIDALLTEFSIDSPNEESENLNPEVPF